MARISTYAIDNNVTSQDKWIGTDSNGSITKNFTPQGVADWINSANAVGVAGQMNFKFQTDLTSGRASGTVSFDAGGGNNTAFSSVTTFKLSKYNSGALLILDFLNILENEYVLFCQTDDINNFGVYKITDITQDVDETNFYDVTLTLIASNGTMLEDEYYSLVAWPYNAVQTNDKHYTFTQVAAASSWNITHNLNKYPSVSIVDSGNNWVVGDIEYINTNELTVNFTAAFSGKAYLN